MTDPEAKSFLNPITMEANFFLKTLERYGSQYQYQDTELLYTMHKLVDAINKFFDQSLTKIQETDNLKLIKAKETEYVVRMYQCGRCPKFLGPSPEKVAQHIQTVHSIIPPPGRKKRLHTTSEGKNGLKLPKKARSLLTGKLTKVFTTTFQTAEKLKQIPEYGLIEEDLISSLQGLYPDKKFKTCKFGSRISGVGNMDSDLDIFVDIDGSFHNYNYTATTEMLEINKKVSTILKKDKKWSQVIPIHNARVPIIRLRHVSTKINCDIGFSNSLGYCNTLLMQYFFELQPIAARMCVIIKEWLERTKLNENISTYSFTLMVIFYLQTSLVLPSIEDLQRDLENKEFIGPWISNFHKKSLKELNLKPVEATKSCIREHMYKFFAFFAEFDYDNYVICPYKGEAVKIEDIIDELPERYKTFVESNEGQVELQLKKPMVVQDPIELSHNVTKSISKALLKVCVAYFLESAKIISTIEPSKPPLNDALDATNNNADSSNAQQNINEL